MRLIFLFVAIALAVGTFVVTMHFTKDDKKTESETQVVASAPNPAVPVVVKPQVIIQKVPTRDVYTARTDIPVGAIISQDMLDIQPWPEHLVLPDMVEADPQKGNDLVKMIARSPFQKGEPIIRAKLANEGDPSFVAGALPKGMRLVTISVDTISGVGGFVFPGDHVDILITHTISLDKPAAGASADGSNPALANNASQGTQVTEVLLSNVRVVAIGQRTATHSKEQNAAPSNVSVEVTASDAQRLNLAESGNGRLSLVLRSIKDADDAQLARPTGLGDLSRLTPPSYFSVLYDGSGQSVSSSSIEDNSTKPSFSLGGPVTVVRGIREEKVEVSRP